MTLVIIGKSEKGLILLSDTNVYSGKKGAIDGKTTKLLPMPNHRNVLVTGSGLYLVLDETSRFIAELGDNYGSGFESDVHKMVLDKSSELEHRILQELRKIADEDLEVLSTISVYSLDRGQPTESRFYFCDFGQPLRHLGKRRFEFPFASHGMNTDANNMLTEAYLRLGERMPISDIVPFLLEVLDDSEKRYDLIGGDFNVYSLEERMDAPLMGTFQPKQQAIVQDTYNRIIKQPIRDFDARTTHAVRGLEDLDVLRRLSTGSEDSAQQLAYLKRYLELIPQEGHDYRLARHPLVVEPEPNIKALEKGVNAFSRHNSPYFKAWIGRAMLTIADLQSDKSLYSKALGYLDRSLELEGDGPAQSWLGKAYAALGRNEEARNLFHATIEQYRNIKIRALSDTLALLRSLKGMVKLGYDDYKKDFFHAANHVMSEGELTKERIKLI